MNRFKLFIISSISSAFVFSANVHAAYDDAGTNYSTDTTKSWVDMGPAMEPLNFTSFLVCIINKTGASSVVNGTYNALVNTSDCQTGTSSSKPEIAKATVTTSRASNSSPQIVKVWFDAGAGSQYLAEATVTEGISASAPYGSFTFSWSHRDGTSEKGSMTFRPGTSSSTIKMAKQDTFNGFVSLNGEVNNDKTSGQVAVNIGANAYVMSFNSNHVNIKKNSDAAACSDRTSLTEYVYDYNIYDQSTGARKNLTGPFQCTYDSSGTTKQCYIGPYGAWYEGGETNITSVTHSDGTVYSGITYDSTDANNDGFYITVPGYTFSPPIVFAKSDQVTTVQTAMSNNTYLEYYGENSLYGLPWLCSTDGVSYVDSSTNSCTGAKYWRPSAKLANGTVLTDTGSTSYVVKAAQSMKVMGTVASSNCSTLDVTGVGASYPALTSSDITAVSFTWDDKPTVTASPKVIDGVVQ
ncbi:MAG: hypothetical protein OEY52_15870 [Gammaproteobacteria bacterium]|nr:hypothetical protein [Gammaproteobacteria bacterium]